MPIHLSAAALAAFGKEHDGLWRGVDTQRAKRVARPPQGVFLTFIESVDAAMSVLGKPQNDTQVEEVVALASRLAMFAAWRVGKDVYRFDPDLYAALAETEGLDEIPGDAFGRLPAWGVYIEAPISRCLGESWDGFFATPTASVEGSALMLLFVKAQEGRFPLTQSIMLDIGRGSVGAALADLAPMAVESVAAGEPRGLDREEVRESADAIRLAVSLVLYLAAPADGEGLPERPAIVSKRVHGVGRVFPAESVTEWPVGARIGAALRAAFDLSQTERIGTGSSPRPHLRRAHWHRFRYDQGRSRVRVRWLHPILVAAGRGDVAEATVHDVAAQG